MVQVPAELKPYLAGKPREEGDTDLFCPLHPDSNRSATVNFERGIWKCHRNCGGGKLRELLKRQDEWVDPPNGRARVSTSRTVELPSEIQIKRWQRSLTEDEGTLDAFQSKRGLSLETIRKYRIGYDVGRGRFTIPVYGQDGSLHTVRFYKMSARDDEHKFISPTGHGSAFLYPASVLDDDPDTIVICEGELDALILIQHGFVALTRTGAANVWKPAWSRLLEGKTVYLCHDTDEAGQKANRKVGISVAKYAAEVRLVNLPYPITEKHGKDVTDFFTDRVDARSARNEFRALLASATLFDAEAATPTPIDVTDESIIEARNAERIGEPMLLNLQSIGKITTAWAVPRLVSASCDEDAGTICNNCSLKGINKGELEIQPSDDAVLSMIEAKQEDVDRIIKARMEIPVKCPKVRLIKQRQTVEKIVARPHIESINGTAMEHTTLDVVCVGSHKTPSTGGIQVVGAPYVHPKTSKVQFQAWDIRPMDDLEGPFVMTSEVYDQLKQFQPAPGEEPIEKLIGIAEHHAQHVTHIYERPLVHVAMDLVWHSIIEFDFRNRRHNRGWLDMLVLGDTRTGKTEIARILMNYYRAGEMTSAENASIAGLMGGVQQIGGEWHLSWGAIPLNDRRLVVIDEAGNLSPDQIGEMSSMRSSGVAIVQKIRVDRAKARTRLIWLSNPREEVTMASYQYGVYAIKPLIGRAEDIARFDLATTVTKDEVNLRRFDRKPTTRHTYTSDACSRLVKWAWSRHADHVIWEEGAEQRVERRSAALAVNYSEDPPLILRADIRYKVARIAVAIAARLFSTDEEGARVIVTKKHVDAACEFIDRLYSNPSFGYRQHSEFLIEDEKMVKENRESIKAVVERYPGFIRYMRQKTDGKVYKGDLSAVLGIEQIAAEATLNQLYRLGAFSKEQGGQSWAMTPTMIAIIKEIS